MDAALYEILKNMPVLSDVDEDDLADVVKKVTLQKFAKDSYVFHEGDKGEIFYIIKSGKVEILRKDENNQEKSIAILYPDNFFGEMALLNDNPRNASVKCLEDSELFVFNKKDFFDFLYL